jgi:ABC-type multidrug transport system permease subunit
MSGRQIFFAAGALIAGVFVIGSLWVGFIPHGFSSKIHRTERPIGFWIHIAFGVAAFLALAWLLFRSVFPGRI